MNLRIAFELFDCATHTPMFQNLNLLIVNQTHLYRGPDFGSMYQIELFHNHNFEILKKSPMFQARFIK